MSIWKQAFCPIQQRCTPGKTTAITAALYAYMVTYRRPDLDGVAGLGGLTLNRNDWQKESVATIRGLHR
jgi:hypothetical protein